LKLEQQRQQFFERERRDWEVYPRLTERQRRSKYWRRRVAQWKNAEKVGLILLLAGEELPEPLTRALAEPPTGSSLSGLFPSSEGSVFDGTAAAKKGR
jgi:hypothetical protein